MRIKKVYFLKKLAVFVSFVSLSNFIFPQNTNALNNQQIVQADNKDNTFATKENELPGLPQVNDRQPRKTVWLTVTAYSSSPDETSGDPFITASGERVKDGTLAHNFLPFGTKVRFPEKYGNKIFTVEDRLAANKGYYIADIWMPSKQEAKQWGARVTKMEIL